MSEDLRHSAYERVTSSILTLAAVIIAVVLVHREFAPSPVMHSNAPRPPEKVSNWNELVHAGITIGDSNAPVQIVEFADFECPFCRKFEGSYEAVVTQFPSKVSLIFIQFPLSQIHRFAMPAARAADCALRLGAFKPYHDLVYAKQDSLGLKSWASYAFDAGIRDTLTFRRCAAGGGDVPSAVTGTQLATRMHITATPAVFINGWRYFTPPEDSATLTGAIRDALAGKSPRGA